MESVKSSCKPIKSAKDLDIFLDDLEKSKQLEQEEKEYPDVTKRARKQIGIINYFRLPLEKRQKMFDEAKRQLESKEKQEEKLLQTLVALANQLPSQINNIHTTTNTVNRVVRFPDGVVVEESSTSTETTDNTIAFTQQ